MFVAHVVRQFHPSVGGLENHVLDLASRQLAAGNRVRVVTLDRPFKGAERERQPATENLNGIEIVRIPYFGSSRYPIALSVLRHIKDAGIVHVHAIDFFFDYLAWTKPIHGRRLVASTHGGFFHTPYAARLKRLWFSTITRLSSTFYEAVIAVSASDFNLFRAIRPAGLACIEQGVNISKFHDASAMEFRKSIISIGRFARNKRIDLLVGFLQALRRHDPEWRLTIAGRPDDLLADDVRALVEDAGLADAVDIVASPSEHTLRHLMHESSFLASASEYEGFGITPIEGMSAGLIPLLSNIPPFQRLAANTACGMIIDFADPDRAARGLLKTLPRISSGYAAQRAACMQASNAYDWRNVCQAHADLYETIAGTKTRTVLGIPIQVHTFGGALRLIDKRYDKRQRTAIAFANAHILNVAAGTPDLRRALRDAVVFNDGAGADIASVMLYGSGFPENLNGTDFVPNYLRHTTHRYRIFLLGAKPGVAERAAEHMLAFCPRHEIVGVHHGYFDACDIADITSMIRRSGADIVLVAMGNPRQELFIHDHLAATGCVLGFGVGALFDFLAGEVPRAQLWVQRWRLEWVYRLLQEPKRLARRYIVGNPLFIARVLKQWWSGSRITEAWSRDGEQAVPEWNSAAGRNIAALDHECGGDAHTPYAPASRDEIDEKRIVA